MMKLSRIISKKQPKKPIQGFLDTVEDGLATGWAYDPNRPGRRIPLQLSFAGQEIETVADVYRSDLQQMGKGDGRHAFEVPIGVDPLNQGIIRMRVADTGQDLNGSPFSTDITSLLSASLDTEVLEGIRSEIRRARSRCRREA